MKQPNKRLLKKLLSQALAKEITESPIWEVLLDIKDYKYYLNRAQELIAEAKISSDIDYSLTLATALLTLSRYYHGAIRS